MGTEILELQNAAKIRRSYIVERNEERWVWVSHLMPHLFLFGSQAGCTQGTPSCAIWSQCRSSSMRPTWEAEVCGEPSMSWATTSSGMGGSSPRTPLRPLATSGQSMCMRQSWAFPGLRPTLLWALQNERRGSKSTWAREPPCVIGTCGQLWKHIYRYWAKIQWARGHKTPLSGNILHQPRPTTLDMSDMVMFLSLYFFMEIVTPTPLTSYNFAIISKRK